MEQVKAEILVPFSLHFSDLITLSSSNSPPCSAFEQKRLENILKTIMETLGPSGPGLLTITGVPKCSELRRTLLPLARKLALLNNNDRKVILQEQSLGTDVSFKNPDRSVSSFALQLKYVQNVYSIKGGDSSEEQLHYEDSDSFHDFKDSEFRKLGSTFEDLGICMIELGLQLAKVCDKAIGGNELEQSILDSSAAKGRLIHYHSTLDNVLLKSAGKTKWSRKKQAIHPLGCQRSPGKSEAINMGKTRVKDSKLEAPANEVKSCETSLLNLWQQWHYDYGIFTVMTAPMFLSSCDQPAKVAEDRVSKSHEQEPSPTGHTCLQIFDSNKNKIFVVRTPPDSFIIQVGESADIISNGKLHSTLHSVSKPVNLTNLSRETFVVFLQPEWGKTFSISHYHKETPNPNGQSSDMSIHSSFTMHHPEEQPRNTYQKIQEIVPPLLSRVKDGMTFAEFSRETTKQYYGRSGMQSTR
ncbi:hypothetical protein ACHQM5_027452 [Ranunculus cassubicifolius]